MPRISLDKNGALIERVLHTNNLQTLGDVPAFPDLTAEERFEGITHKDVSDAEYWALVDAKVASEQTYQTKRQSLYPSIYDLADAMVKKASLEPVIRAAGETQFNEYVEKCLAVKMQVPKE